LKENSILKIEIDTIAPNWQRQTTALYCEMSTKWETKQWQYIKRLWTVIGTRSGHEA
jgi:hypothetical protein